MTSKDPVAVASETATRNPHPHKALTEHSAPTVSCRDKIQPVEVLNRPVPERHAPQMPSLQPLQSPKTGPQQKAYQGSSVASQVGQRQPSQPAPDCPDEIAPEQVRIAMKASQDEVRKLRAHAASRAILPQCYMRRWRNLRATFQVLWCLIIGDSPETVRPCSAFVMRLWALRKCGEANTPLNPINIPSREGKQHGHSR